MIGIKPITEALRMARDSSMDLIEIAPNAKPPVCKIGNISKFIYEREKKNKDARKNRSAGQVKEVRFRIKIGEHDFLTKLNRIVRFLKERHKVRVSMIFFGREMQHRDLGERMMSRIEEQIKGVGSIEQRPQLYGNRMISILVPTTGRG